MMEMALRSVSLLSKERLDEAKTGTTATPAPISNNPCAHVPAAMPVGTIWRHNDLGDDTPRHPKRKQTWWSQRDNSKVFIKPMVLMSVKRHENVPSITSHGMAEP
jgi:hypothetical protein